VIPAAVEPLIRRAILDLLHDSGGEINDDVIAILLAGLGHRVARRDVAEQMLWLADAALVKVDALGPYLVARILADGRDVSDGRLVVDGVWRHKTGD
jgi:hypothetical protein